MAQQSDIDSITTILLEQADNQNKLFHNQESMLSVFNQSQHFIERLVPGLEHLKENMGNIQGILDQALDIQDNMTLAISNLQLQRAIDNNILRMQEIVDDFNIRWQLWHSQKLQLERGILTDDILPMAQLTSILEQVRSKQLGTLDPEWYYSYLNVKPLTLEKHQFIYIVEIPGVSLESYTHFSLTYYPTPIDEGLYKILQGADNVVLNSATNVHFDLNEGDCIGSNPMICKPLRYMTRPSCETDLLSGLINGKCTFKLIKNRDNSTLLIYKVPNDENTFV